MKGDGFNVLLLVNKMTKLGVCYVTCAVVCRCSAWHIMGSKCWM